MKSVDSLILRTAGIATAALGLLITVIGTVLAGSQGLIGGLFGTVVVLVFFSIGQFVLGAVLRSNPQMAMSVAMLMYLVKIGVLLVLIFLFADTTLFDTKVFALAIVLCTLMWTGAEVWVFARTKVLYVEPERDTRHEGEK